MDIEIRSMDEKLEKFLLLAKTARGPGLGDLITKVTAEPGIYRFGELLVLPQVQELETGEYAGSLSLLQLFAYGTWSQYKTQTTMETVSLSSAQQTKLKVLTVASMAAGQTCLSYDKLMEELEFKTVRELEDFLIEECIYPGILRGRFDQVSRILYIKYALTRDVSPDKIDGIVDNLEAWMRGALKTLECLQQHINYLGAASAAADSLSKSRLQEIEASKAEMQEFIETKFQKEQEQDPSQPGSSSLRTSGKSVGKKGVRLSKRRR